MRAARDTPAVVAQNLRKQFQREGGGTVRALDGVSFEASHGELTALVGPDGAGKTTLMRLAAGLLRADAGCLKVLGVDVAADPQQVQDRISYMPQRFGLYDDLTVAENLELYANLHGVSADERAQRYPELLDMTALGSFMTRLAGQLSGGMKQKLGLACTLVRSPELLLLDEPTVGVDPLSRRELWDIVRRLVADRGLTVLLSTAYLDRAAPGAATVTEFTAAGSRPGRGTQFRGLTCARPVGAGPAGTIARPTGHHRCSARRGAGPLRARRSSCRDRRHGALLGRGSFPGRGSAA
jgi:ABC-2 type transport system ATP-binding protein